MLRHQSSPSVSEKIVRTVADHEGIDPTTLDTPLFDAIDPDALDSLFAPTANGTGRAVTSVGFRYAGYRILVDGDGDVRVEN